MTAGPRAATYASADASHTTVRLEGLCPVGSRNWPNHQTEGQEDRSWRGRGLRRRWGDDHSRRDLCACLGRSRRRGDT